MKPPAGTLSLQDAAKALMSQGISTGPCLLFRQLRRRRILTAQNLPYTEYIRRGWFSVARSTYEHPTEGHKQYCRTFITEKGISALKRLFARKKRPLDNRKWGIDNRIWHPNVKLNLPECVLGF